MPVPRSIIIQVAPTPDTISAGSAISEPKTPKTVGPRYERSSQFEEFKSTIGKQEEDERNEDSENDDTGKFILMLIFQYHILCVLQSCKISYN